MAYKITEDCIACGACMPECPEEAISEGDPIYIIDPEKCTACNDCVEVCPKGLFSLEPVGRKLWVACKSQADGDTAEAACEVACTACGKCVADAPPKLMSLVNNLATINYDWNIVWENETTIDDRGWYVELAIPLSQLRFRTAIGETTWARRGRRR